MNNLDLWDKVKTTDPKFTKPLPGRGNLTSIDAYYQIHRATKQFGAVGQGWGWEIKDIRYTSEIVAVHIHIWVGEHSGYDSIGSAKLYPYKDGKEDEEATKKALTNAVSKGLSYMGFSADVYFGSFEDEKGAAEQKPTETATTPEDLKRLILDSIWPTKNQDDYKRAWNESGSHLSALKKVSPEMYATVRDECGKHAQGLT